MTPKQLEKLEQTALKLINIRLQDNILNLVCETVEDMNTSLPYDIPEEFMSIKKELNSLIIELSDQLEQPLDNRSDYIHSIFDLKSKLVAFANPVYMYGPYLNQVGEFISKEYKLKQIKSLEKFHVDHALFLDDVSSFIQKEETDFENHFNMSRLISHLPLRMTKDKYADYIKDSFRLMFEGLSDVFVINSVELLKQRFSPESTQNFGKYFSIIYDELKDFEYTSISELPETDIEDLLDTLDDTFENLSLILNHLDSCYNNINYLLNLASFCVDKDYIFAEDFTTKDMYYAMCDILDTKDSEIFTDNILETTCDRIEALFEESRTIFEYYERCLSSITEEAYNDLPEDILTVINTHAVIESNFYRELTDEFSSQFYHSETETLATKELIDSKAEEFIIFINEHINNISISQQKFIKQLFLENIPCPYDIDEYLNYVEYVLDGLGTSDLAYLTYMDVFSFYEQEGYSPYRDDSDEHHDHCSCGHDHNHNEHHHHNCDCGHHHHS